jgi:UrcA family protein
MTIERPPEPQTKEHAMRKPIFTVLAALTAAVAAPAAAEAPSVTVRFGDLDLATPAGKAALDERIEAAVNKVCSPLKRRELWGTWAAEECRALTLADAMEQLAALTPPANVELAASAAN